MKLPHSLRFSFAALFQRSQIRADMDDELRSHIQLRADDLERSGLPRADAERRARIEFGGREKCKEEIHETLGWSFLGTVWQDIQVSLRVLRKSPGFTIAAVLTLALAIGANAVVFSVMDAFVLRPLNVPHAQSLYALQHGNEASGSESYADYVDLRDRNRSFESLIAYNVIQAGLDDGQDPSSVWALETSGNYFDALGLRPDLGQFFHASNEHGPNSAPYIVLSYDFWHTHFHDDPGVVGRAVRLNKHPFTVLGVGPRDFNGTLLFFNPEIFIPIVEHPLLGGGADDLSARDVHWVFELMGHLKAGVTPAQAVGDLNSIGAQLEKAYPKDERKMTFALVRPNLYGDYLGRPVRAFTAGLMLLAGLILLAACANLGTLFSARAADRSREVALRLALGSSRKRILRGLFSEALLISLAGGAAGLGASVVLLRAMSAWRPFPRWPAHIGVNPDATVYVVALLLALVSGLLFGAVPVRQVLATNPYEVVKAGLNAAGPNRKAGRRILLRDILLVVQIAICAVLVTSSMVAVRGLARSLHANFGFEVRNTMLAELDLGMADLSPEQVPAMQKQMLQALQALPGVESVGFADCLPLVPGGGSSDVFTDNTTDLKPSNAAFNAPVMNVSPEYFQAAGTALLSGRAFTWQDDKNSPRVGVVNGEFARKLFSSAGAAIGRLYKMKDGTRIQIVGVAEDGKYASLTEAPRPVMFLPILQSPSPTTQFVVRSSGDPQLLTAAMRGALRQLDAGLPILIEPRDAPMDTLLFGPRMATIALGMLGMMGVLLSITGIFGMAAYSVSKRLRELGIRMALGAQRKEIVGSALGRPLKLLALGSAAGLFLGLLATKVLAFIVYQATPRDPLVLAGVVVAMALLGLVATWIPAQRALSVNPLELLREE
jgi:predicted permease